MKLKLIMGLLIGAIIWEIFLGLEPYSLVKEVFANFTTKDWILIAAGG